LLTARPSRRKRKADEKASQKTKTERARRSATGQVRSSAVNVRVTPSFKALLDKASADMKVTQTQLIEQAVLAFVKARGV
jgi:hypothetical protein